MSDGRMRIRAQVIAHCRRLAAQGLMPATSGNLSARVAGEPGLIAVTPTATPYDLLEPDDVALVADGGEVVDGRRAPTTELPLHLVLYARRPEVGAVVHTHSPAASVMAVMGWTLPPILTGLAGAVGGDVRVAAYARPGTHEVGAAAADALADRGACLLRHHGVVAIGRDLAAAATAAWLTENAAQVYLEARATGAQVPELDADEVEWLAAGWREQWEHVTA
jgi:L-ribulose-5-phosphate 4-epimerase